MALQKQPININFAQGLDTKTDPLQVSPGRFLELENTVFQKGGRLQKRNGFGTLTNLSGETGTFLTTFNDNLVSIGERLEAYASSTMSWVDKGPLLPVSLDTLPLVRSNTNQTQADIAIASNGLVCTAFTDSVPSGGSSVNVYKYVIADSITGQNIVAPTTITSSGNTVTGAPRVFLLGNYFIILFTSYTGAFYKLEYIAVSTVNTSNRTAATTVSNSYSPSTREAFDGVVAGNNLYLAWNGADIGDAIRMTRLTSALGQSNTVIFANKRADEIGVCADTTGSGYTIYANFYDSLSLNGFTLAVDQILNTVLAPTQTITNQYLDNITGVAADAVCQVIYEVSNQYTYDSGIDTNLIKKVTITQAGSVGSTSTVLRSVGLASKAFVVSGVTYFLCAYSSENQPTYFLSDINGNLNARLAYSNGGGYVANGLPNVSVTDNIAKLPYLFKDSIQAVNKSQGLQNPNGIYSQLGVNLASFTIGISKVSSAEIGNDLHLSGGFLWMYDGYSVVEHGFHLYPEYVEATPAGTGGLMSSQEYFYQVTYEWSDNQGNVHRSAPSIPLLVDASGLGSSTCSVVLKIPTLRLTYKTANPVKIVIYRWSTAQQSYYQTTEILNPILNDTTVDYITYTDTHSDAQIIGNNLIYTTGGVLENIPATSTSAMTLFGSRLFYIDAEDKNLLGFSKQVIENTPVETSDLLSIFVAPTIGVNGSTGPMRCLSVMDDKLIIAKKNAFYYINGIGPDNTGANSQFSEPIFITATVGCDNQQSIVLMPNGLMFQSDKGIWLLGRDLSTSYIGAPVETYTTGATVLSALNIPGTNQVRFTLDSGVTLMYDYYYNQWGTFTDIPAISSTLYQNLHTYINQYGQVLQETPGVYLDGSNPVTMNFKTGWMNLAGLQGFERAYFFYILGQYISPHKLAVAIAYDYSASPSQVLTISPDNYSAPWGDDTLWGGSPQWGGEPVLEQWRVFFTQQKCQAFQISIKELFDPSFGIPPGAGLTISGLDLIVALKKGYTTLKPSRSAS